MTMQGLFQQCRVGLTFENQSEGMWLNPTSIPDRNAQQTRDSRGFLQLV